VLRGIYEDLVEQWLNLAEQVAQLEAERVNNQRPSRSTSRLRCQSLRLKVSAATSSAASRFAGREMAFPYHAGFRFYRWQMGAGSKFQLTSP
jgi:hypothetical protein